MNTSNPTNKVPASKPGSQKGKRTVRTMPLRVSSPGKGATRNAQGRSIMGRKDDTD